LLARPVLLANIAQALHVSIVPLEDIKQRPLEQLPVPPVRLVLQDLPIRPLLVPPLPIGRVLPALHVPLVDGEVLPAQQPRIQGAYPA
jgi:hypothetical protein